MNIKAKPDFVDYIVMGKYVSFRYDTHEECEKECSKRIPVVKRTWVGNTEILKSVEIM